MEAVRVLFEVTLLWKQLRDLCVVTMLYGNIKEFFYLFLFEITLLGTLLR